MALRWIEGFEGARNVTLFSRLYAVGTGTIADETGFRSGSALSSANLKLTSVDLLSGAADENVWILGFAMRLNASAGLDPAATTIPYISLRSAAGEQLRFEFIGSNDSKPGGNYYLIRAKRGSTTLATTTDRFPGNLSDNQWIYFELKATVRTGTNGSFSLVYHKRRTKNITAAWDAANTGVNTANQGADGADRFELALTQSPATSIAVDNIYVCDGSGSINNDRLGEVEIEAIDVSGDGATDQWDLAGAAASVEDAWNEQATIQSAPEDDKRTSSASVGEIELAALGNPVQLRFVSIKGVQTAIYGRMESSGSRTIQFWYRRAAGPSEAGTASITFSSTALVGTADCRETDPNTSSPWTLTDVDGLQVGAKLTS